jgi:uncharacterized caspase-like protein
MKKALIIGINNYPNKALNYCVNDAHALTSILETNGDGSPNFEVVIKTDIENKTTLKRLIEELFSGDSLTTLLYFSGHGYVNELGGYIVTPDATKYDEGVSMDDILKLAVKSKSKNRIIILDCCHSGALADADISSFSNTPLVEGITILTASRKDEAAMEVDGHGVFTGLLLDALKGGASELRVNITPVCISAHISRAVGYGGQRPVFKTNVSRFTTLREISPQVSKETIRRMIDYFPTATTEFQLDPEYEYTATEAKPEKVTVFKELQQLEGVGLVIPVGEEHMYWAAMNHKSCKLTALGYHYWRLVKMKRI